MNFENCEKDGRDHTQLVKVSLFNSKSTFRKCFRTYAKARENASIMVIATMPVTHALVNASILLSTMDVSSPTVRNSTELDNDTDLVQLTVSGRGCKKWTDPTQDNYKEAGDHALCRNPNNWEGGLWCYTTDPDVEWERCDEYMLTKDEKKDDTKSVTKSGRICQAWNEQLGVAIIAAT